MIQLITLAKNTARWISIWAIVTFLLVGSITSVTWARLALAKTYWTVNLLKTE